MENSDGLTIEAVDYTDDRQMTALLTLLDEYARSEFGGGEALPLSTRELLPASLQQMAGAFSAIAWFRGEPLGLVNCLMGLSTFKARPILNIHDIAVAEPWRGKGVGTALLGWVQDQAVERGCCKITLEVLSRNEPAKAVYRRFGFEAYQLDDKFGQALFWQKLL